MEEILHQFVDSFPHYLTQVLCIPGADQRISQPSTVGLLKLRHAPYAQENPPSCSSKQDWIAKINWPYGSKYLLRRYFSPEIVP